jgi:Ca2+/Na+ antiporter
MIRFRGYLTFEDSLKVQEILEGRKLFSSSTVITVATLGITAFIIYKMQVGMLVAAFLLLFMAAFMYIGLRFMKSSAKKTQEKMYGKACTKRTGTLTNNEIIIRKKKNTTNIPWKIFEKAVEIENIVTIIKDKETLSFARYMFDNEQDWAKAKKLIKSKYSDKP